VRGWPGSFRGCTVPDVQRVDVYGLVGQVLDGQFRVDAPVGEGGCSVVYRGHHLGLDVAVAIKCLKLHQQLGSALLETFERRFRDESKIQYRLSQGSLHIARSIAAGTTLAPTTGSLVPYMVLEWLDGFTLAEQLRARRERGEHGRPLAEVLRFLEPVAEAMSFAHALGVAHRDLNPSNIFVEMLPGGTSRLKVVDFGVAKVVSDHALDLGPRAATLGPIKMFTPAYGAPEQFSDHAGAVGLATDVYAFALVLLELLTDRPPVEGESVGEFMERALDPIIRPSPWTLGVQVGEAVEQAFLAALRVDPAERPADIGEFWASLRQAASRDDEASRRMASQPPPPAGAALTARGTVLMPQIMPRSQAPPSSGPGTIARGGTAPMRKHPGHSAPPPPAPAQAAGGSQYPPPASPPPAQQGPRFPMLAPDTISYGSVHPASLMSAPSSVVIPSPNPMFDAYGPTADSAEGRAGSSPLSTTVTPGEELMSPGVLAAIEQHQQRRAVGGFLDAPTAVSRGTAQPPVQQPPPQQPPPQQAHTQQAHTQQPNTQQRHDPRYVGPGAPVPGAPMLSPSGSTTPGVGPSPSYASSPAGSYLPVGQAGQAALAPTPVEQVPVAGRSVVGRVLMWVALGLFCLGAVLVSAWALVRFVLT
jgi:eukaryotic-like serine/threonine-protein kinase